MERLGILIIASVAISIVSAQESNTSLMDLEQQYERATTVPKRYEVLRAFVTTREKFRKSPGFKVWSELKTLTLYKNRIQKLLLTYRKGSELGDGLERIKVMKNLHLWQKQLDLEIKLRRKIFGWTDKELHQSQASKILLPLLESGQEPLPKILSEYKAAMLASTKPSSLPTEIQEFEKEEFFRYTNIELLCSHLEKSGIKNQDTTFFNSLKTNIEQLFEKPRRVKGIQVGSQVLTADVCDKDYVKCEGELLEQVVAYCNKGTAALSEGKYETFFKMWYHTRPTREYNQSMASGIARKSERFATPLQGILDGKWTVWRSECSKRVIGLAPEPWKEGQRIGVAFCNLDGTLLFYEDFRTSALESVRFANLPPATTYQRRKSARIAKLYNSLPTHRRISMASKENIFVQRILQATDTLSKLQASWDYRTSLEMCLNNSKDNNIDSTLFASRALTLTIGALDPLCSEGNKEAAILVRFFQKVLGFVHCVSPSSTQSALNQFNAPHLELYSVEKLLRDEVLNEIKTFRQLLKNGEYVKLEARSWINKNSLYAQHFDPDVKDYTEYIPHIFGPYLKAVEDDEEIKVLMSGFGDRMFAVPSKWIKNLSDAPKDCIVELRLGTNGYWQIQSLTKGTYLKNSNILVIEQPFQEFTSSLLLGHPKPEPLDECSIDDLLVHRAKLELAFYTKRDLKSAINVDKLVELSQQAMKLSGTLNGRERFLATYLGAYFAAVNATLKPISAVESRIRIEKSIQSERDFAGFEKGGILLDDEATVKDIHERYLSLVALVDQKKYEEATNRYGLGRHPSIDRLGGRADDLKVQLPAALKDPKDLCYFQPADGLGEGCIMLSKSLLNSTEGDNKQIVGCHFLLRKNGWFFDRSISRDQVKERFPEIVEAVKKVKTP